ncbi:MAG: hypothetical protein ACLQU1_01740 [Bryobacteraceae bacterium]
MFTEFTENNSLLAGFATYCLIERDTLTEAKALHDDLITQGIPVGQTVHVG